MSQPPQTTSSVSPKTAAQGTVATAMDSARDTHSEQHKAQLRALLDDPRGTRSRFPAPLEARYREQAQTLTLTMQRAYWPWVALTVTAFCVLGFFMAGEYHTLINQLNLVIFVAVMLPVCVLRLPRLEHHINKFNGLAAAVTLLSMHFVSLAVPDSARQKSVSEYAIIFITIAAFTIARLPVKQAAAWVIATLAATPIMAWLFGLSMDLDRQIYFAGGSLVIGYLLGFIQDSRERTVFLQSQLLEQEKEQLETLSETLAQASRSDKLTGLPNRRHFDEMLDMQWKLAMREGKPVNLMFMDIDDFKAFNDYYGHQVGDDCLLRVAKALGSQALRGSDFIARYGGEEFVALFPGTDAEGLRAIAHRLIAAVDALQIPHARARAAEHVTLSVGIATVTPTPENHHSDLVRMADEALYTAKGTGRHRFVVAANGSEE